MKFLDYVKSFYEKGGVYPLTKNGKYPSLKVFRDAIKIYKTESKIPFDSDSLDREGVRLVLEEMFNYKEEVNA